MVESAGQLKQGSIVWASVKDPRGKPKTRPVVVITSTDQIILDALIAGVAITTTFADPPTEEFIELPWYPMGHPATRLKRRSAAVCDWVVSFRPGQVKSIEGFVPTRTLLKIVEKVRHLNT